MTQNNYTQKVRAASAALLFSILICASGLRAQQWNPRGPVPRSWHTAVYDSATGRMIIFGGLPDGSLTNRSLNDVFWLLNASSLGRSMSWQAVNPTGRPPAPRQAHSAVYDSTNSRMIVFGGALGRSSPCENDTWILNHANGVAGTPAWLSVAAAGTAPLARAAHAAVYDPGSDRMIIFGGSDCFSGVSGCSATPMGSAGPPRGRSFRQPERLPRHANNLSAVYDPTNNIMIIFGGVNPNNDVFNDVWTLSNANGTGGTPT